MAPNLRLRTAAEERMAAMHEKDSTFGPRPTPSAPPPGPVRTNTNEKPNAGVYRGGSHPAPIPNTPGVQPQDKKMRRPGETRA